MRAPVAVMLLAATTAPLVLDTHVVRRDSSATSFEVALGGADYADISRGCEGGIIDKDRRHIRERGVSVTHEFTGPLVLGFRATEVTRTHYDGLESRYWRYNPHVALEKDHFGAGLGWFTDDSGLWDEDLPPISAHLRFGNPREAPAAVFSMFEDVPAYSPAGAAFLGLAYEPRPWLQARAGMGFGTPYDQPGAAVRCRVLLPHGLAVGAAFRGGASEGINENGVSVSLGWTLVHKRTEVRETMSEAREDSAMRADEVKELR